MGRGMAWGMGSGSTAAEESNMGVVSDSDVFGETRILKTSGMMGNSSAHDVRS